MATGEFELIADYFNWVQSHPQIECSVGDDAAVLSALPVGHSLAVAADTLVADVHFPASAPAYDIATRAMAVNMSDLAAMGAKPYAYTLALTLPNADEQWLKAFSNGLRNSSELYGIPLVGGDTTKGPLCISLQLLGLVQTKRPLLRSAARVGEGVYIDGSLGDGAAALALSKTGCLVRGSYLHGRFYAPGIQLQLAQNLLSYASAAIDVSDGLLADLNHIAKASDVALDIEYSQLPVSEECLKLAKNDDELSSWVLSGGDDYRLAFTMPDEHAVTLKKQGYDVTRVGEVSSGSGVQCRDEQGRPIHPAVDGFTHFR